MKPYLEAQHAMQTGVAMEIELDNHSVQPKHLRVGINTALCDQAALVRLLITKGIISNDEYLDAIKEEMNAEVTRYEIKLSDKLGKKVTLV